MNDLAVVPRPGKRDYRARKAPTVGLWMEQETGEKGATVYRTHDAQQALQLVRSVLWRHGMRPDLSDGEQVWMRQKPEGWERVSCDKSGAIPCVVFRVVSE